jgi:hypothetical protein
MPVKKRSAKAKRFKINHEVVDAYREGDFRALHRLLGLRPWEMSPLPNHPLGCDPMEPPPIVGDGNLFSQSWQQAVELQREIEAALKGTR